MNKNKINILLVEKNGMMSSMIMSLLHKLGFKHIMHVEGVEAAQKQLSLETYDLVIFDWDSQESHALNFLRFIRNTESTAQLPFVMISGIIEHNAVGYAISLGVTEYIVKPFTMKLLEEKITQALQVKKHKVSDVTPPEVKSVDAFYSKIIVCLENDDFDDNLKSQLKSTQYSHLNSIEDAIKQALKDIHIDILIVNEPILLHQKTALNELVELSRLGQIDIVFLSASLNDKSLEALHKLGIQHVVNPKLNSYDLSQRISMLVMLKKAMINTNKSIRKVKNEFEQDRDIQADLAHLVSEKTNNLKTLSEQISNYSGTSNYITALSKEITQKLITIDSLAKAIESVNKNQKCESGLQNENIKIIDTVKNAQLIFQHELSERHIVLSHHVNETSEVSVNPTLFNSLIMFLLKSLIKDVNYGSAITIKASALENKEMIALSLSASFPSFPHFKDISDHVLLLKDGNIKIQFKHAITQLIDSQLINFKYTFNMTTQTLVLNLFLKSKNVATSGH